MIDNKEKRSMLSRAYWQATAHAKGEAGGAAQKNKEISPKIAIEMMDRALAGLPKGNRKDQIAKVLTQWKKGLPYYQALAKVYPR